MRTKIKESNRASVKHLAKPDRMPIKFERFIKAITTGILAASQTPGGTVNASDYLDASQLRMLDRLAKRNGQTPRQFIQSIIKRMLPKAKPQTRGWAQ